MVRMGRSPERVFEGLRVIDFATVIAAPAAARMFSDLGADVIKVEAVGGDNVRGQSFGTPTGPDENPIFTAANSGKRLIALNLKTKDGYEAMMRLLGTADVFISNVRYASIERLGLAYDDIKERFPRLIYGHFSGYGLGGPDSNVPAYDLTAFWARNGALQDWQVRGGSYVLDPGYASGDLAASLALYSAVVSALYAREKTGKGTLCTASLQHTGIWMNMGDIVFQQEGYRYKAPRRVEAIRPFHTAYKCGDGVWVIIVENKVETKWHRICDALGLEAYKEDPRFTKPELEVTHEDNNALKALISERAAAMTSDEMAKALMDHDITCSIVRSSKDVINDVNAAENGYLEKVTFDSGHSALLPTVPMQFSEYSVDPIGATKPIGNNTDEVLKELGYSEEEIAGMRSRGSAV